MEEFECPMSKFEKRIISDISTCETSNFGEGCKFLHSCQSFLKAKKELENDGKKN